jgi:hypothetical protein
MAVGHVGEEGDLRFGGTKSILFSSKFGEIRLLVFHVLILITRS